MGQNLLLPIGTAGFFVAHVRAVVRFATCMNAYLLGEAMVVVYTCPLWMYVYIVQIHIAHVFTCHVFLAKRWTVDLHILSYGYAQIYMKVS